MAAFTDETVKNIATTNKTTGRQQLAKILNLKKYDAENDLKAAIYIDFLYDNIIFAAQKGFPWNQVSFIVQFAQKYLQECQGLPLSGAVHCYKENSEGLASILGERNFKVYTDYVFSTFLSHYQLFTYVFSRARQTDVPTICLDVHVPIPPDQLPHGKGEHIWQYEKKIQEMEDAEMKKAVERATAKQKQLVEEEAKKRAVQEKCSSFEKPFTKESLGGLIQDVLQSYTSSVMETLSFTVQETKDDLEVMLGKTSVPRPQELGPPPRYKLKTPITAKSANKNRPNKSNDSGRLSVKSARSPKSAKSKASKMNN